ncbi:MAG: N-formylglutamate amidohydrolase, partial [Flammeovirgaceae bacterium]|nr:N-formylglutamate amidohydrolase [Flammeovirgaceae bacterium]
GQRTPCPPYASLFDDPSVVESHRGWDPGALEAAQYFSESIKATLFTCTTSRLLIEVNRSLDSPELFSEYTQPLPSLEKKKLISEVYLPYRKRVEDMLTKIGKPVLHLSIHSFTPVMNMIERKTDVGLLFDPASGSESSFCFSLREQIKKQIDLTVDFNEPYKGVDDGFTTSLRNVFDSKNYLGIEIEINQRLIPDLHAIVEILSNSTKEVLKKSG